jgi:hypothetical protein
LGFWQVIVYVNAAACSGIHIKIFQYGTSNCRQDLYDGDESKNDNRHQHTFGQIVTKIVSGLKVPESVYVMMPNVLGMLQFVL